MEASLAEEGRLLVPRRSGHGDGTAEPLGVRIAEQAGGGTHLGQEAFRYVQLLQNLVVPLQIPDVEHEGAGGVGIVGLVDLSLGQLPHEPGVHVSKEDLSPLRPLPDAGHVLQDPSDLGAGKIGVDDQAGLLAEGVHQPLGFQAVTVLRRAAALPDDGVADGLAGLLVPDDGSLPLVGDPKSRDVFRFSADLLHGPAADQQLGLPDLVGIMLHPAGLRVVLGELPLGNTAYLPLFVEQDAAVAGGSRVQGHDVLCHGACFSFSVILGTKNMPCLHISLIILYHHIIKVCKGKLLFVPQGGAHVET